MTNNATTSFRKFSFTRTLAVSGRVFKQFRRDRRTLAMVVILPILFMFVFGITLSGEIKNVPIIIEIADEGFTHPITHEDINFAELIRDLLLEDEGVFISFHILLQKAFEAADFAERHIEIIREDKSGVYFVEIRKTNSGKIVNTPLFPAERLAEIGSEKIQHLVEETENAVIGLKSSLRTLSYSCPALEQEIIILKSSPLIPPRV